MTLERPKRRRLAPEVRRDLILDAAARIVSEEGVSPVSMERIGREAGVSKALVYSYFLNRNELLSALLLREYPAFQRIPAASAAGAQGFEAIIRSTTRAYLDHVAEKGVLIQRLMNEPAVAKAVAEEQLHGREATSRYFGQQMARAFAIDQDEAAIVSDILMGLTGAAGNYMFRTGEDIEKLTELVVRMIMAAVREVAAPDRSGSLHPRGE